MTRTERLPGLANTVLRPRYLPWLRAHDQSHAYSDLKLWLGVLQHVRQGDQPDRGRRTAADRPARLRDVRQSEPSRHAQLAQPAAELFRGPLGCHRA